MLLIGNIRDGWRPAFKPLGPDESMPIGPDTKTDTKGCHLPWPLRCSSNSVGKYPVLWTCHLSFGNTRTWGTEALTQPMGNLYAADIWRGGI